MGLTGGACRARRSGQWVGFGTSGLDPLSRVRVFRGRRLLQPGAGVAGAVEARDGEAGATRRSSSRIPARGRGHR